VDFRQSVVGTFRRSVAVDFRRSVVGTFRRSVAVDFHRSVAVDFAHGSRDCVVEVGCVSLLPWLILMHYLMFN